MAKKDRYGAPPGGEGGPMDYGKPYRDAEQIKKIRKQHPSEYTTYVYNHKDPKAMEKLPERIAQGSEQHHRQVEAIRQQQLARMKGYKPGYTREGWVKSHRWGFETEQYIVPNARPMRGLEYRKDKPSQKAQPKHTSGAPVRPQTRPSRVVQAVEARAQIRKETSSYQGSSKPVRGTSTDVQRQREREVSQQARRNRKPGVGG